MERPRKIGLWVRILSNQIGRAIEAEVTRSMPLHVTGMQGRVLGFIRRRLHNGPVFQKDVEDEFDIRRSTATGMLQTMEKNGLLQRESVDYDARLKKLVLTEKALEIHDQIIQIVDGMEAHITEDLSDEEIATFLTVMQKIEHKLKQG